MIMPRPTPPENEGWGSAVRTEDGRGRSGSLHYIRAGGLAVCCRWKGDGTALRQTPGKHKACAACTRLLPGTRRQRQRASMSRCAGCREWTANEQALQLTLRGKQKPICRGCGATIVAEIERQTGGRP